VTPVDYARRRKHAETERTKEWQPLRRQDEQADGAEIGPIPVAAAVAADRHGRSVVDD